jgi:hypothetical protein
MWFSKPRTSCECQRRVISPLQGKGMMFLALVFFTESVTLTKAVRTVEAIGGAKSSTVNNQQCTETSSGSTCTASPPIKRALGGISNRYSSGSSSSSQGDCCGDFQACTKKYPRALEECTLIPRGGDVATSTINAAAAGAAAATEAITKMPYNIPLNGWKIIFQVILTTINVVCWLVPLKSKSFGENKLALSLANAFSGGVFLSLAFGHLIPECVDGFASSLGHYNEALPYMLVLSGYLLIFFVEKVAFDAHDILHEMEKGGGDTQQQNESGKEVAAEAAPTRNTSRSAVILLAALAVHSILEMMALGLSDSFSDSAILTISIALHQVGLIML